MLIIKDGESRQQSSQRTNCLSESHATYEERLLERQQSHRQRPGGGGHRHGVSDRLRETGAIPGTVFAGPPGLSRSWHNEGLRTRREDHRDRSNPSTGGTAGKLDEPDRFVEALERSGHRPPGFGRASANWGIPLIQVANFPKNVPGFLDNNLTPRYMKPRAPRRNTTVSNVLLGCGGCVRMAATAAATQARSGNRDSRIDRKALDVLATQLGGSLHHNATRRAIQSLEGFAENETREQKDRHNEQGYRPTPMRPGGPAFLVHPIREKCIGANETGEAEHQSCPIQKKQPP